MKISSKEINIRKQNAKSPLPKFKGMSKSLSKPIKCSDAFGSPVKKNKDNNLKVIKQVVKKKKQDKKDNNKQKEKKKKTNYCVNLKQLKPVNLQKQKQIFFQKEFNYNPLFVYPNISDLNDEQYKDMKRFDQPDGEYLKLALAILQKSLEVNMCKLLTHSQTLTKDQVSNSFNQYIRNLDIGNLLTYQFVENTIAPTSVVHNNQDGMSKVMIGLPIKYRVDTIQGVLNHEIGTHFIRKYNDKNQKWFKDRKKYNLSPYLKTEQGLASLNQLTSYVMQNNCIPPLLYRAALLYYGCYLAAKTSFSKIFQVLAKYQPDPEMRWKECVRVKRGIADTSKPFGMYKDQIYFMGAIQILKNRRKLNMIHLHCGKITVEDCLKLTQRKQIQQDKIKLPHFLKNMKFYMQCLDRIAQYNMIAG